VDSWCGLEFELLRCLRDPGACFGERLDRGDADPGKA